MKYVSHVGHVHFLYAFACVEDTAFVSRKDCARGLSRHRFLARAHAPLEATTSLSTCDHGLDFDIINCCSTNLNVCPYCRRSTSATYPSFLLQHRAKSRSGTEDNFFLSPRERISQLKAHAKPRGMLPIFGSICLHLVRP